MEKRYYGIFMFSEDTGNLLGYDSYSRNVFTSNFVEYSSNLSYINMRMEEIKKFYFGYQPAFVLRISSGYLKPLHKKFGLLYFVDWYKRMDILKDKNNEWNNAVSRYPIVPFYEASQIIHPNGVAVKLGNTSDLGSDGVTSL